MKKWTESIKINAPIDEVWKLFDGSLDNMQKIMPQVVENKPVKLTDEVVGSVYRQQYKEGKRIEEYDVETLKYIDHPEQKELKVGFTLAKIFEITAFYELTKLDHNKTLFTYTATNKPLKWFAKIFVMFGTKKVVVEFVERVKAVAEEESKSSSLV